MRESKWEIRPLEFDVFIGLDVDKKSLALTSFNHKQKIASVKMPNDGEILINYTKRKFPDKRVVFVYEAGPTGYGLYDKLNEAGYKCLVTNPASVPTPSGSRVKTNRVDSIYLGRALRGGTLKSVRVPSRKYRDLRLLVQLYDTVIQQVKACKCRIKGLLLLEGIPYPSTSKNSHWANNTIKKLEELECESSIRFKLDDLLEELRFQRQRILKVKQEMRNYCRADSDLAESVKCLLSIPGVGWLITTHVLARIGDWRNLKNARELGGFIGLTPCEKSTGENINKGHITRAGDQKLRRMLVEGAWSAIVKDPDMVEFYHRIQSRHPRNIAARKAIVAVARKMTTRIYRVLKDRRPYIITKPEDLIKKFNIKRRLGAPEDDSTVRRTGKRLLREDKILSSLPGSPAR